MTEFVTLCVQLGLSTAIAALYCWAATRREERCRTDAQTTDQWIRAQLLTTLQKNTELLSATAILLTETRQATVTAATASERLATLLALGDCPLMPSPKK